MLGSGPHAAEPDDLLEGLHEWRPVHEIVRLTFKALHDVVKAQGDAIKNIERGLSQTMSKQEAVSALSDKVNLPELSHTFDELSKVIDAKADASDVAASLDKKASRLEMQTGLKLKADITEVHRCLEEKANAEEVRQLLQQLEERRERSEERLLALIDAKASAVDLSNAVQGRASLAEVSGLIDARVENLHQAMSEALASKPSKQTVATALQTRPSHGEVEAMLQEQAEHLTASLASKAEVEAVGTAMSAKASRAELRDTVQARLLEVQIELERHLADRVPRTELDALSADIERRLGGSRSDVVQSTDALQTTCSRLERELRLHMDEVQNWLNSKATVAEVEARPTKAEVEFMLARRLERADLTEMAEAMATRMQTDTRRAVGEVRAELEERRAALRAELRAEIGAVGSAVRTRVERAAMDAALEAKADVVEMHRLLQSKANAEDVVAQSTIRAHETSQELQRKADLVQLSEACEQLERRVTAAADEGPPIWQGAGMPSKHIDASADTRRALADLRAKLDGQPDAAGLREMIQLEIRNGTFWETLPHLHQKADVDDVNRSLMEVNRELSLRPTLSELNRVVGEQSLIMESLCSEHLLGRWIWKSGRTRGEKHMVPWNVQNINTNPDNFMWEKDKCVITCVAPGLYEVTFGFYTRRKPAVQLLVNGEPVLSAVNSASYAVHHSSGRLAAVGPHSAGHVTGLTLIDFLALPPKARISCSYQGEEGEGFIGLRKM